MKFNDCLVVSIVAAAEILLFRFAYLQRQSRRGSRMPAKSDGENTV